MGGAGAGGAGLRVQSGVAGGVGIGGTANGSPSNQNGRGGSRGYVRITTTTRPTITAIAANPIIIDSGGTTALTATVIGVAPLTYQWLSPIGGVFDDNGDRNTDWTDPTSIDAIIANLTLTVSDSDGLTATRVVQVTVRAFGTGPLVLTDPGDQTGETGDIVDLSISAATGGRSPYAYVFADLPEELGAIGRRIRGVLTTPGTPTVMVTVTDANGDTAVQTFTWTVTGDPIVPPPGINVRIDWGDASFIDPNADVTGRITSGIQLSRGKASNTNTRGRTAAGRLTFQLDNSDGLYDLENVASPLNGLIRPGIRAQVRDGGAPLWTGVLDSIPTTYRDNGQHRASVTAFGVYSTLRDASITDGSLSPATTGTVFCDLLESVDECGVVMGAFFSMPRWWESGPLREALRHIEDTEGGFIYEDRLGQLGFQSGAHRDGLNVSAQFTGIAPALPGEIRISGRPKRDIAVKDVTNEVVGLIREYALKTGQPVFERGAPIAIGLGDTVTLISDYEEDGAATAVDAVTTGDYTATRDMDGGPDRRTALTVTATIGQFNEIRVEVVYPVGGGFTDQEVFLRSITVNGTVLSRLAPAKVTRRDDTSIGRYKLKTLTLRDTWIDNAANMTARADSLLAALATPETRVEFPWIVEDYALFRALELSDRIRLKPPWLYRASVHREHRAQHPAIRRSPRLHAASHRGVDSHAPGAGHTQFAISRTLTSLATFTARRRDAVTTLHCSHGGCHRFSGSMIRCVAVGRCFQRVRTLVTLPSRSMPTVVTWPHSLGSSRAWGSIHVLSFSSAPFALAMYSDANASDENTAMIR